MIRLLEEKSSKFKLNGYTHSYDHKDPIFFRDGPLGEKKAIKKCPSCRHEFADRGEMRFCSFCGNANDEKCMKKTRLYPLAPKDDEGNLTARGPICRLCDRKFHVRSDVTKVFD